MTNKLFCIKCKSKITRGDGICSKCGHVNLKENESKFNKKPVSCVNCHYLMIQECNVCPNCGESYGNLDNVISGFKQRYSLHPVGYLTGLEGANNLDVHSLNRLIAETNNEEKRDVSSVKALRFDKKQKFGKRDQLLIIDNKVYKIIHHEL